jgi:O-antigen ligase
MFRFSTIKRVTLLVSIALFVVTLAISPASNIDPINVPKFWMLLIFGFAVLAVLISDFKGLIQRRNMAVLAASMLLAVWMLLAFLFNDAPISQQLFGTNGRNTGLLTYIAFAVLFIGSALATNKYSARYILIAISATLIVNVIYGFLQAIGSDPVTWSNPYSSVIGTFGNPNFAAAFLGMGVAFALPFAIARETKLKYRLLAICYVLLALFDISKSDAQQGLIVAALSAGLIGFFWLRSIFTNPLIRFSYLGFGLIVTILGILGTLQKGPLQSILYKPSVTYRGDYWQAGLVMLRENPLFGVGLDSYGDYYRSARTIEATLRRGPSTVSNAAHNVFIDIGATAGIVALIAYLLVILLGFRAMWNISKKMKNFDSFVVAIFVGWVGYLVQSIISINNIALGIWGWVLPGILIGIERWKADEKPAPEKRSDFSGMFMVTGLVVGGVIGFFPFNADANFRHSIEKGDATMIISAVQKWPNDVSRLNYAASLFNSNKLEDKAYVLSKEATELNPRSFDAWNLLYSSKWATDLDKAKALEKMKNLDPHNPELTK